MNNVARYILNTRTVLSLMLCVVMFSISASQLRWMYPIQRGEVAFGIPGNIDLDWVRRSGGVTFTTDPCVLGHRIPFEIAIGVCAFLPILRIWSVLRRRRLNSLQNGHCASCGYDLRATHDRCPECGTIPTKATA
jgi:hypothetical protein